MAQAVDTQAVLGPAAAGRSSRKRAAAAAGLAKAADGFKYAKLASQDVRAGEKATQELARSLQKEDFTKMKIIGQCKSPRCLPSQAIRL